MGVPGDGIPSGIEIDLGKVTSVVEDGDGVSRSPVPLRTSGSATERLLEDAVLAAEILLARASPLCALSLANPPSSLSLGGGVGNRWRCAFGAGVGESGGLELLVSLRPCAVMAANKATSCSDETSSSGFCRHGSHHISTVPPSLLQDFRLMFTAARMNLQTVQSLPAGSFRPR